MEITTVGLDVAKQVFQLHGVDAHGEVRQARPLSARGIRHGQPHAEARALPDDTLYPNAPPKDFQQSLHDMEPQPAAGMRPRCGPLHLAKGLKNVRLRLRGNPDPRIRDAEFDPSLLLLSRDRNTARFGELDRIAD
jgi:hypothetical protein